MIRFYSKLQFHLEKFKLHILCKFLPPVIILNLIYLSSETQRFYPTFDESKTLCWLLIKRKRSRRSFRPQSCASSTNGLRWVCGYRCWWQCGFQWYWLGMLKMLIVPRFDTAIAAFVSLRNVHSEFSK